MPLYFIKTLLLVCMGMGASMVQDENIKAVKTADPPAKSLWGAFGRKADGVGFVFVEGHLFVEAIVIHDEVVESGIFQLDTGTSTGCVMENYFAEKMKVSGLENITLKFGDIEIEHVKTTSLDHPELQKIFKEHTGLFQNRPICGVIGYPVVAARRTVLDFGSFSLQFLPDSEDKNENAQPKEHRVKGRRTIPFRDDLKSLWIEVTLNDQVQGVFQVRTGSPTSWIHKEVAEKAGLREGRSPRSMKVDEVELCPISLDLRVMKKNMEARSPSFPVIGYLGTDFLSHFKTTIDPKNRQLILDPLPVKKGEKKETVKKGEV